MRFLSKECLKYACGAVLAASLAFAPSLASAGAVPENPSIHTVAPLLDQADPEAAMPGGLTPGVAMDALGTAPNDIPTYANHDAVALSGKKDGGFKINEPIVFQEVINIVPGTSKIYGRFLGTGAAALIRLDTFKGGVAGDGTDTKYTFTATKPAAGAFAEKYWLVDEDGDLMDVTDTFDSGDYTLFYVGKTNADATATAWNTADNVLNYDNYTLLLSGNEAAAPELEAPVAPFEDQFTDLGIDTFTATVADPSELVPATAPTPPTGWEIINLPIENAKVTVLAGDILVFEQDFTLVTGDKLIGVAMGDGSGDFKVEAYGKTAGEGAGYDWLLSFLETSEAVFLITDSTGDILEPADLFDADTFTVLYAVEAVGVAPASTHFDFGGADTEIQNATRIIFKPVTTPPTPGTTFKDKHYVGVNPSASGTVVFKEGPSAPPFPPTALWTKENLSVVASAMPATSTSMIMAIPLIIESGDLLIGKDVVNATITLGAFSGAGAKLNLEKMTLVHELSPKTPLAKTFYVAQGDVASAQTASLTPMADDVALAIGSYVVVFAIPDAKTADTAHLADYSLYDTNSAAAAITTIVQLELSNGVKKPSAEIVVAAMQTSVVALDATKSVQADIPATGDGAANALNYIAFEDPASTSYLLEQVSVQSTGSATLEGEILVFKKVVSYTRPSGVASVTLSDTTFGITKFTKNADGSIKKLAPFTLIERKANPTATTTDPASLDGKFWVVKGTVDSVASMKKGDAITADGDFILYYGIKGGGDYDTNPALDIIADPNQAWANAVAPTPAPSGGGSSSGCTVGTGSAYDLALLFLALMGMVAFRAVARKNS